ncbi:MAG: hypothetical protein KatS3mg082_1602 [Nitrospiraceae bacterium]|jgi:Spy/CpxP family protein refolding chaperone|nr:MAG: hypothetical protein KatS3mg082_1602 [Nitrospiraceae bacterium]
MKAVNGVALLAVMAVVLAGCSSYHQRMGYSGGEYGWEKAAKDMTALVDKTIQDPAKAKQVNEILGEILGEIRHSTEQSRQYHQKLYELNANYEAAPEDFTTILDDMNNHRMRSASKILGLRFKMKEILTAQEWKALSDVMAAYRGRYRHGGESGQKTGS